VSIEKELGRRDEVVTFDKNDSAYDESVFISKAEELLKASCE
jgi:hypothetical protein